MNTLEYAKYLRSILDFKSYANLVYSLGNSLNGKKDRFDKSDIIEQSIEVFTERRLKWIDEDGRDHNDVIMRLYLELKYVTDGMWTSKRKDPKKTVKIKIKNSLGTNKGINISNPADYYMICQQDSIAIISWENMKPFLKTLRDGIEANIPFSSLTFIFKPEDISSEDYKSNNTNLDYKFNKRKMQREVIENARL